MTKIFQAFLVCFAITLLPVTLTAQPSTVYATVISTKLFIVGAANPQTGLFYQRPQEDTVWHHLGAKNIRANNMAAVSSAKGSILYIASGNGLHQSTNAGATWKIMTGWEITELLSVCVDPTNSSTLFIGTAYGVYQSKDAGKTWKQTFSGFTSWIVADHSNSSVLYCATEKGVYKSTDAGESWNRTGLSIDRTRCVAQHPGKPEILFVGTEDHGIYTTDDAGKTWRKVESGIDHKTFYTIAFDPGNPEILYAGGYVTGVYKSVNGGRNWKRSCKGLIVESIHSVAVDPTDGRRIYAATIGDGVYRSDDAGETWRNVGLKGSQVWRVAVEPY